MNEQTKNGGPAFPSSYEFDSLEHIQPGEIGAPQRVAISAPGMTLRDYFAAKAVPAVMAAVSAGLHNAGQGICAGSVEDRIAFDAYRMADAMLAAREVTP